MKERAAIYARVSTLAQSDNYSTQSQIEACQEYASARGYTIVGNPFIDEISSSEEVRPGLEAAQAHLLREGFEVLIVHSLDRLARDPFLLQILETQIQDSSARVEFVLGGYEPTPEGDVLKTIVATMARFENVKRTERTMRGKLQKAKLGKYPTAPPFGYVLHDEGLGGVRVDETQAEVVRFVYEWFTGERESIRGIANRLNQENHRSPRGGTWGKSTIHRILKDATYTGTATFNKTARKGNERVTRPESEWIMVEVPPIIDLGVFNKAQKILDHNRTRVRSQAKQFYLLSGMVTCANCGKAYHATNAAPWSNLKDPRVYRHRESHGHCCNDQVSAGALDMRTLDFFFKDLFADSTLSELYDIYLETEESEDKVARTRLEKLESERARNIEKIERLIDLYEAGNVPLSEVRARIAKREAELVSNESDIESLRKSITTPVNRDELMSFQEHFQDLVSSLKAAGADGVRSLMLMIGSQIQLHPKTNKATIEIGLLSRPS